MTERIMPSKNAIIRNFSNFPAKNGILEFSGFNRCLKESREVTGRDPENGTMLNPGKQGSWLGAVGYMALLDQIGSCFKPKDITAIPGNTIKQSLGYFTDLNDHEIDALYALRCAFTHDFSIYNINKKHSSLTHSFSVGVFSNQSVVTLPAVQWDGDYNKTHARYKTAINLSAFGNLVESVCTTLVDLFTNDQLDIVLVCGSDELLQRYSYHQKV